jgi:hypothetical protein
MRGCARPRRLRPGPGRSTGMIAYYLTTGRRFYPGAAARAVTPLGQKGQLRGVSQISSSPPNSPPSRLAPQHGGRADGAVAEFEALYRANVAAVTAYFARRSADPQTVADLTADTFAQAITSFATFDPRCRCRWSTREARVRR